MIKNLKVIIIYSCACLVITTCTHKAIPPTEVMPIGIPVTGIKGEIDFCNREPDQCDPEDDGGSK